MNIKIVKDKSQIKNSIYLECKNCGKTWEFCINQMPICEQYSLVLSFQDTHADCKGLRV